MKKLTILKVMVFIVIVLFFYVILKIPSERIYKINILGATKNNALVEDFNNKLNENYWNTVEQGNNYNNELQYYRPDNLNVNNGFLEIEAKKENFENHQYTSGQITTKGKFEFLYGKIIFKTKPVSGQGLLSAVWLLPADDSLLPEIDIIEVLGNKSDQMWTGVHYLDSTSKKRSNFVNYMSNRDFSTYELDWEKDEIRCYVNNQLIFQSTVDVPNKKMYLIIDLAVGGDWPKNPDDSIFPTKFLIDYIIIIPKELDTP